MRTPSRAAFDSARGRSESNFQARILQSDRKVPYPNVGVGDVNIEELQELDNSPGKQAVQLMGSQKLDSSLDIDNGRLKQSLVIQRKATQDLGTAVSLFEINSDIRQNFDAYVKEIERWRGDEKDSRVVGLLNWTKHYRQETAGSDAELRRVLYHEGSFDGGRKNKMTLGKNQKNEPDLIGSVAGRSRAEEVKAITASGSSRVGDQINSALAQLEKPRAISKEERKVVVYIYNKSNPWPFDSIKAAAGKSTGSIRERAIKRLTQKHQRAKGGIHLVAYGVNKFAANGIFEKTIFVEMTWPNASEKKPANRRLGIDADSKTTSPFRSK